MDAGLGKATRKARTAETPIQGAIGEALKGRKVNLR
jgi:hypothetical protein